MTDDTITEALELASIDQLLQELLRRQTFRGLLFWQKENFTDQCRDEWHYEARHCDPEEVLPQLLQQIKGQ